MRILSILLSIAFLAGLCSNAGAAPITLDSVPALHNIKDSDIVSIKTFFENSTLTVTCKDGNTYTYLEENWDFERTYPSLSKAIRDSLDIMARTFTKTEYPPHFTGGEEAWEKYIAEFCKQHKKEIKKEGGGVVWVQFIVHMKGQLSDVQIMSAVSSTVLAELAVQAVRDSPVWTPASQNGYRVVSYGRQLVNLTY